MLHHRHRGRAPALAAALVVVLAATLSPTRTAVAQPGPGPAVKVNQVAYVPGTPKQATVVTSAGSPTAWTLRDSSGAAVASGQTTVYGTDQLSGDQVHTIDFSSYDTPGSGYVLSAAGDSSYPFDISADPVERLRYDALAFFYHQRSGTPIQSQFVGGQYARPAGHVNASPNQGDDDVPCRTPCGYTLDVRGGWYDAGDHGKYGVNSGIAAWQLINAYERTLHIDGAGSGALGDSTLAIPERGNGIPDILDEARWEVEFLLRMQVPDGRPDAGMVHHRVSDENWTDLPMLPHQDPQPRLLSAVTTNATLNLAALAAQAARVWRDLDPAFSARALSAAERAYAAAEANPGRYADPNDGDGGGTYVDNDATDEFFWAAAELYVTTGQAAYRNDLTGSRHFRGASLNQNTVDWWNVTALGNLTLAMVPNGLPDSDIAATRDAFASYANQLLAQSNGQAYPAPTHTTPAYRWGSNGIVANGGFILAVAYDFTGQERYRAGVYQALDYLFGRNPYSHSYVTGYGEQATRNVHHRHWANQADPSLPTAPPGALAGGPNTGLEDPLAQQQLAGCRPQKCYLDDIEAWSVNEVAINWNAALAWVASWAAEHAGDGSGPEPTTAPPTGGCAVDYSAHSWSNGFTAQVTLTNTSSAAWNGWSVSFSFADGQSVTHYWSSVISQSGAAVTATNANFNATVAPGGSVEFGFNGAHTGTNDAPTTFVANGVTCT